MSFWRLFTRRQNDEWVSMLDVDVRRRELGLGRPSVSLELMAMLCLSESQNRILIAPMYCSGGPHIVREPVKVIPFQSSLTDLGRQARETLLAFEVREPDQALMKGKPRDNPLFKVAGLKALREYEREYKLVTLQTLAGSLRVEEAVEHSQDPVDYVRVCGSLAPACSHEDLGLVIFEVYRRGQYLRTIPRRT